MTASSSARPRRLARILWTVGDTQNHRRHPERHRGADDRQLGAGGPHPDRVDCGVCLYHADRPRAARQHLPPVPVSSCHERRRLPHPVPADLAAARRWAVHHDLCAGTTPSWRSYAKVGGAMDGNAGNVFVDFTLCCGSISTPAGGSGFQFQLKNITWFEAHRIQYGLPHGRRRHFRAVHDPAHHGS